jgi:hypothetical protein
MIIRPMVLSFRANMYQSQLRSLLQALSSQPSTRPSQRTILSFQTPPSVPLVTRHSISLLIFHLFRPLFARFLVARLLAHVRLVAARLVLHL